MVRSVLRALAWAYARNLNWEDLVRLLRDLPPGHPLEKPLLVYIARVYREIEEADVRRALEETRPDNAEELTMTVAEQWVQRGRQEAEVKTLLRLIERKFGPQAKESARVRVERATIDELEMCLDRILDAERLEDIFFTED